jgi:hypothetical protein
MLEKSACELARSGTAAPQAHLSQCENQSAERTVLLSIFLPQCSSTARPREAAGQTELCRNEKEEISESK